VDGRVLCQGDGGHQGLPELCRFRVSSWSRQDSIARPACAHGAASTDYLIPETVNLMAGWTAGTLEGSSASYSGPVSNAETIEVRSATHACHASVEKWLRVLELTIRLAGVACSAVCLHQHLDVRKQLCQCLLGTDSPAQVSRTAGGWGEQLGTAMPCNNACRKASVSREKNRVGVDRAAIGHHVRATARQHTGERATEAALPHGLTDGCFPSE